MKTQIKKITQSKNFALIFGSLMVVIWTMVRFFSRGLNFDQIGQQVLAHQWLNGLHSGSVIGPTNYVLKMIFLYIPFDALPLPAQFKLIFLTLLINIATFLLVAGALQKIIAELFGSTKDSLYISVIYLSLISGSVYWISYLNSRNLEVAVGLWLVYLLIRLQNKPSRNIYVYTTLLSSFLFFADPLQIYMTLIPGLIFVSLRALRNISKPGLLALFKIIFCAGIGIVVSHLMKLTVENIWSISFINTPQTLTFSLPAVRAALSQTARIYAGGYEAGRLREAIDLLTTISVVTGALWLALRNPKTRQLIGLASVFAVIDLSIYIISGQAQQTDTNRYLIMTVPMFIMVLVVCLYYLPNRLRLYISSFVIVVNVVTLLGALATNWDPHFSHNSHSHSTVKYMKDHKLDVGYASINTALSSDYLSNNKVNLLPIGCDADLVLKQTNLFFDKAAFDNVSTSNEDKLIPIILDGNSIKINQAACNSSDIKQQLGNWQYTDTTADGSKVLYYKAQQLKNLRPVSSIN